MKKLALLLVAALCFTLCACPALEEVIPEAVDVHISAGKIEPGMTAKDILVEVVMDGQPIPCRVNLTGFTDTGYYDLEEDEPVPEGLLIRLNVFYSLPKGLDVDSVNVTMDCDGGVYDGTGSFSSDDEGRVEAWSYAFYGEEETPEETTETPTETPTEAPTEPPAPTEAPKPTEAPHTHSWKEDTSKYVIVDCVKGGSKTYVCDCGETKKEVIPAPGHDMKEGTSKAPTCTEDGSQTLTCSRCGMGLINTLPATGHSWSAWAYENGRLHKRTCSVCSAEEEANHDIPSGSVTCTGCGEDIVN